MDENTKRAWLKRVLFLKVMMTLFAWGLPVLLADAAFLDFFNLSMPEDPIYLRLFGAACTAFGVADRFAYRDPQRNRAIIQAGIVDNALVTIAVVMVAVKHGIESWYIYTSAGFTAPFCLAFFLLLPA